MPNHSESIAIFSEDWSKIVCVRVIDEKFHVIEPVSLV